jgi:hypothetical protein
MSAVRKWKDPSTDELSNLPESVKFLVKEKTVYEVSAVQIARDFSKKMIEFAQDVKRPDVSVFSIDFIIFDPVFLFLATSLQNGLHN